MAQHSGRHEVTRKRVLYQMPGTEKVTVQTGIAYATTDAGVQTLNLYYPPDWATGDSTPAVLFSMGLSDIGALEVLGCRISEMDSYVSWGRLVAASGVIGMTYTTGANPSADARAVMAFLQSRGRALGIDTTRLGLWAFSSNVPHALAQLIEQQRAFSCAVLCYGFMLGFDDSMSRAEVHQAWRFVNPIAGKTIDDLPADVPLFVVRAGKDSIPAINESIDRFLAQAIARNLPVTFVNHHVGPHGFDVDDDSDTSRVIVRQLLAFLCSRLRVDASRGVRL